MAWTATNSEGYPAPAALATDVVVLTARDGRLITLTTERDDDSRALPGGFVGPTERPQDTALRKLHEKTGLAEPYVEQLGAFADPGRDPRGWIPSIAYLALVPPGTEAPDPNAHWIDARDPDVELAFDHRNVLRAAVERLEGKLWWSNVTVGILPGSFALSDARRVYEAIASTHYDPATFARDLKATGLIEPTGEMRADGPGRPAALYRYTSNQAEWGAGRRKRIASGVMGR